MKGRRNTAYGSRNGNAVLTLAKVKKARVLRARGHFWTDIGSALGCTEATARRAAKGQTWAWAK